MHGTLNFMQQRMMAKAERMVLLPDAKRACCLSVNCCTEMPQGSVAERMAPTLSAAVVQGPQGGANITARTRLAAMSEHKPLRTVRLVRSPPGPWSVSQNLTGTPILIAARPTPSLPLKQSAR